MRGSITDLFLIVVLIFIFAVSLLFMGYFGNTLTTQIQTQDPTNATGNLTVSMNRSFAVIDGLTAFLLVGLVVAVVATAVLIRANPVFIVFFLFVGLVLLILISALFSNVYSDLAQDPHLTSYANTYSTTGLIINNFPVIMLIIGVIVAIVLYGKSGANYGGQV